MRNISRKKPQESSVSAFFPEGLLVHKGFFTAKKSNWEQCQI